MHQLVFFHLAANLCFCNHFFYMSQRPALSRELPLTRCRLARLLADFHYISPISASLCPASAPGLSPTPFKLPELEKALDLLISRLNYNVLPSTRSVLSSTKFDRSPSAPPLSTLSLQTVVPPRELEAIYNLLTDSLMDNFYVNLVSWCLLTKRVAVGVNEMAFWWDGKQETEEFWVGSHGNNITCVKCGGGYVLIGTENGTVALLDAFGELKGHWAFSYPATCASWALGKFEVGDRGGLIHHINTFTMTENIQIQPFSQQVTGKCDYSPQLIVLLRYTNLRH